MTCAYSIQRLTFGYDTPLFCNLDLEIPQARLTAIVGPNGSGKSTLLDLMTGQQKPWSGCITLFNNDVAKTSPQQLAKIVALTVQSSENAFPFSVYETVLMGRHPHIARLASPDSDDAAIVHKALKATDLTHLAQRRITELSGGERQRTMLARTLAQETEVILLDEPTASQDVRHAMATLQTMKHLVYTQRRTVVAVLHDLNHAAAFADHIIFLNNGRVHAAGTLQETMTTKNISTVFAVDCHVQADNFSGSLSVSFRPETR